MMAYVVAFLLACVLVLSLLVYALAKDSANHDKRIFKLELMAREARR
jgi:uncharacterized membrane protein YsdA (DUF1294 family)